MSEHVKITAPSGEILTSYSVTRDVHDTSEDEKKVNKELTLQMNRLRSANEIQKNDLIYIKATMDIARAKNLTTCPIMLLENSLEVAQTQAESIDVLIDALELTKHVSSLRQFRAAMQQANVDSVTNVDTVIRTDE